MNRKLWLARNLALLIISLALWLLSLVVLLLLQGTGDGVGASVAKGVLMISTRIATCSVVGQVVLLSLLALESSNSQSSKTRVQE